MIKTAITEMFGLKYPIICGSMMWLCKPGLCAAISNAGGMGNLTAGNYATEDEFRDAIKEVRALTDKPFMVGITLLPSVRITPEHNMMYARVCAEEEVSGIEVSGAPLDKVIGMQGIEMLKKSGVKMFHKLGSVRHAVHAQKVGYDGVYALGFEAGGHPLDDDVSTMVLTPRIADSVKIPVVTVGGISNGAGMAAALMLGAQGVMMASRFVTTKECEVHEDIKQEFIKKQEYDTTIFGKSLGMQGRALKNELIEEVVSVEKKGGGFEDIYPLISGDRIKDAWEKGKVENAPFMVGQCIGHIREVYSCPELLETMTKDAEKALISTKGLVRWN